MRLKRYKGNPILTANPKNKWEAGSVFNGSVVHDNYFHMVYRGVRSGFYKLKRGYGNYISSIGHAISHDGIHFYRGNRPLIKPEFKWEKYGCEDPRVSRFGDGFYIFYTALSKPAYGKKEGVRIALASTKDFKKVKKHGIVGPDVKSKAGALFPEKINGKLAMLFAYMPDTPKSSIVYAEFKDFNELKSKSYWKNFDKSKNIIFSASKGAIRGQEVGAPPLKTSDGWLLIYCPAEKKRRWSISAALLDLKNPRKVIGKTGIILKPGEKYEVKGFVKNVVFPSGAVIVKDKLYVYYGGGDKCCCLASCELDKLMDGLL